MDHIVTEALIRILLNGFNECFTRIVEFVRRPAMKIILTMVFKRWMMQIFASHQDIEIQIIDQAAQAVANMVVELINFLYDNATE